MAEQVTGPRPIILSANAIVNGQFIRAGDPTPYEREENLPEAMKAFVATGNETPFDPGERDIYALSPAARRAVRQYEAAAAEKAWAEEVADTPLPPETAAVLEDEHAAHIGRLLRQAEVNARLADDAYKQIAEEAAAKVIQFYVRRGGAWGRFKTPNSSPANTSS
jgi:hypothetical protein